VLREDDPVDAAQGGVAAAACEDTPEHQRGRVFEGTGEVLDSEDIGRRDGRDRAADE
jgi:hypothetical protein